MALAGATAACALAAVIAWIAEAGPRPPFRGRRTSGGLRAASDLLEVAGSGSNLPITRRLLQAWGARTGQRFVLHPSIGSSGGLQAVREGAIHVGLLSRPASAQDLDAPPGLSRVEYAWSVVVFAAHPAVGDRDIASGEILALLRGRASAWGDGTPRTFLLRERGDSSQRAVGSVIAGFSEAEREAQTAGRFRVLYSDVELRFSLLNAQGALGVTDLGALRMEGLPLVPLALDGVAPSVESARAGRYRVVKPLTAIARRDADARTVSFLRFLASPEARALVEASGFLPDAPPAAR